MAGGASPRRCPRRQGPGQPALCASLTMCVTAMEAVLPPRPPLVADPLTPIPSGCLLMANSSSRPESALQVPCSTLEPPSAPATHVQAGVCRAVAQTIRVGLFLLTGGYARGAPFVSCPRVGGLPQMPACLQPRPTAVPTPCPPLFPPSFTLPGYDCTGIVLIVGVPGPLPVFSSVLRGLFHLPMYSFFIFKILKFIFFIYFY